MSFIDDMKIGKKMIGGFMVVVLILIVVALIGYINMGTMDAADTKLYEDNTVPIGQLGNVDADFQQIRAEIYRYIYVPSSRTAALNTIADLRTDLKTNLDAYRATPLSAEEKAGLAQFDTNYAAFKPNLMLPSQQRIKTI